MTFRSACGERRPRRALLTLLLALSLGVAPAALAAPVIYEVSINGVATGQIEEFDDRSGDLHATPETLRRLGIRLEPGEANGGAVRLASIPDLRYAADQRRQAVDLRLPPERLATREVDAAHARPSIRPKAGWGALLNYDVYGEATWFEYGERRADSVSAYFGPRLFSPLGVLSAGFIVSPTAPRGASRYRRLETSWSYGDVDDLVRYRVGDLVSSGVPWSRPVYMGGAQAITDFAMRPDLLITPVPLISGVANAPSTVDVLVNGVRQSTQRVEQGPFTITNLPVITGRGDVSLVVRDALGRETVQTFPYYVAGTMLREGLYAFGAEAGFLRRGYTGSDIRYGKPAASGTFRYGVADWITLETHAEGAGKLQNAGVGAIAALGDIGQLNLAGTVSRGKDAGTGYQWFAAFERNLWSRSSNFFVSAQRASRRYADLATLVGARPVRHQYRIGMSFQPLGLGESVGIAATDVKTAGADRFRLVQGSIGYSLGRGMHATLSGYRSLEPGRWSAMLTLNVRLGDRTSAFLSAGGQNRHDAYASADVFHYPGQDDGGLGWRVGGRLDAQGYGRASADLTYLTPYATLSGGAARGHGSTGVRGSVSGSVAAFEGLHLARDIHDGFAVVDAGAPGVVVRRGNVPVGRTGSDGRLLVRNMISYHPNKLGLDPDTLPAELEVDRLERTVSPRDRSGVAVKFPARRAGDSLLARIVLADGSSAPLGAMLSPVSGTEGGRVMVGYDGLAYFKDVGAPASFELADGPRKCRVEIPAAAYASAAPAQAATPVAGGMRQATRELSCR